MSELWQPGWLQLSSSCRSFNLVWTEKPNKNGTHYFYIPARGRDVFFMLDVASSEFGSTELEDRVGSSLAQYKIACIETSVDSLSFNELLITLSKFIHRSFVFLLFGFHKSKWIEIL